MKGEILRSLLLNEERTILTIVTDKTAPQFETTGRFVEVYGLDDLNRLEASREITDVSLDGPILHIELDFHIYLEITASADIIKLSEIKDHKLYTMDIVVKDFYIDLDEEPYNGN